MDATSSPAADFQRQQDRKRKRKALLAGGVVLGLGAAMTLAAWSDDVFADGVFNTGGNFELVAAVNSGITENNDLTWNTYNGPAGAAGVGHLDFSVDASSMEPGETVYAPITLATSDTSDMGGTVALSNVDADGSYERLLNYRIYRGAGKHGENCSEGGVDSLTSWTSPATLTQLTDGLKSLPNPLGPILTGILAPVETLTGLTNISRPVIDPSPVLVGEPLDVGSGQTAPIQHLCVAVEMGLPDAPLDIFGVVPVANSALVRNLTKPAPADNSTTVTWRFIGNAV